MPEIAYVSSVTVERVKGTLRRARLPAEPAPVWFGAHGAVARHYGVPEGTEPHATTLDYVVAAAAG